jgi:hypothetical protein
MRRALDIAADMSGKRRFGDYISDMVHIAVHAAPMPHRRWYVCFVCRETLSGRIWSCGSSSHRMCGECYAEFEAANVWMCPVCPDKMMRRCRDAELRGAWMFDPCENKSRGCRVKTWRDDAAGPGKEAREHAAICVFRPAAEPKGAE